MTAARAHAEQAGEAVRLAEEHEEKVRGELAAAGDPGSLGLLLDRHQEFDRLTGQAELVGRQGFGRRGRVQGRAGLRRPGRGRATLGAQQLLEQARQDYPDAHLDRAAALRGHLIAGARCPVCEQR